MIRILLSDDNASFRQSSVEQGAAIGIEVVPFDDWENAQVELEKDFESFHGVIIDGKGRLRDSSKAEDTKHLMTAIGWLREQRGKGKYIPVVVYTGFHSEIDSITSTDSQILRVFDKSKDTFLEVVAFLKSVIKNSPIEKLKGKHPVVYTFAHKYFSIENQQIVQSIFENCGTANRDFIWKKNVLDGLRRVNEALVDTLPMHYYQKKDRIDLNSYLNRINKEMPPKDPKYAATPGNRSVKIIEFFEKIEYSKFEKERFPSTISNVIKNIYYTASSYTVHTQEIPTKYFPSPEMILGLVYSHFGCYHWFNQIIKN